MRHINCGLIELKFDAGESAESMIFSGYGAVFGNVDSVGDVIEPGAFAQYLADVKSGRQEWPAMLLQHGAMGFTTEDLMPVGVFIDLAEDGKGLKFQGQLANVQRARDAYELMKMQPRPAINGMSIGYVAKDFEPRSKPDDPRRRIKRIDLIEISLVTFPANRLARVNDVKSALNIRDAEKALREAGFSRNEAKAIVARGYQALSQRDADDGLADIADEIRRNLTYLS